MRFDKNKGTIRLKSSKEKEQNYDEKLLIAEIMRKYYRRQICVIDNHMDYNYSDLKDYPVEDFKALIIAGNIEEINRKMIGGILKGAKSLEVVLMKEGVEGIREESFKDCKNLKLVYLPKTINLIEDKAFENCVSLKEVVFEGNDDEMWIYDEVFKGCKSLESVYIPKRINRIGARAFENCTSLKEVVCNDSNGWGLSIYGEAFKNCENLENVAINCSTCTNIGSYAFKGCKNLKYVSIKKGYIKEFAFYDCSSLKSISIKKCERIKGFAFKGCNNLEFVEIGELYKIMEDQCGLPYFEDYVCEAYKKEKQLNDQEVSVLKIKPEARLAILNKNGSMTVNSKSTNKTGNQFKSLDDDLQK